MILSLACLISALSVRNAIAWGGLGHATIATIADNYLDPKAKVWVSDVLGDGVSMPSVASWADSFRYTASGRFSAGFHYIDAEDSPPSSCSVVVARDCGPNGCIVSAISNYTERVQQKKLPAEQRKQALEFLIHLIGDITQFLHVEAEEVGGNKIKVTWKGEDTNLHSAFDTAMVEEAAGGPDSSSTRESFSQALIKRIDDGIYDDEKDEWVACSDITRAAECALAWAKDTNKGNCQYVLKTDVEGKELEGEYYEGAKPLIEVQIAKGGYRLAAWINALARLSQQTSS